MLDIIPILSTSELFSGLSKASLERIALRLKPVSFARDVVICREGEAGSTMYVITKGNVSVSSDMGWGQRELDRKGPGAVFGEMALITNDARSATVRALEATECLQLDSADFDSLLDQDPDLAQRIAKIMTRRFSSLVHRTSNELIGAYRALIFALANMTESRDPETGAHLERTRNYCVVLAEELMKCGRYRDYIDHQFIDGIYQAAPLHDIGKVAIADAILFKPERLGPAEFERMKAHTTIGASTMEKVIRQSGADLFGIAQKICLYHHERWDGSGYPEGLSGESIPVEARIMAIADVYDALLSKRVYKPAMSMADAREWIKQGAGTQFDPDMVAVMLENIGRFEEIYLKFQDEDPSSSLPV
jgi:response regulator RpfG family c-di-GMP phosphodiesterase